VPFGDNDELRDPGEPLFDDAVVGHVVRVVGVKERFADGDVTDLEVPGVEKADQQGEDEARRGHVAPAAVTDRD
jgi:hypothetical protein